MPSLEYVAEAANPQIGAKIFGAARIQGIQDPSLQGGAREKVSNASEMGQQFHDVLGALGIKDKKNRK